MRQTGFKRKLLFLSFALIRFSKKAFAFIFMAASLLYPFRIFLYFYQEKTFKMTKLLLFISRYFNNVLQIQTPKHI